MKTIIQAVSILSATAAAKDYYYTGEIAGSTTATGTIAVKISYTTAESYSFTTYHKYQFLDGAKFTGTNGQIAEMFSCLWPSECTVHRVSPKSDLSDYILDTEIYIMPDGVTKPIAGWYTDQDARFSTSSIANQWTVAFAATTQGANQSIQKTRAFEEAPVETAFIEPTKW